MSSNAKEIALEYANNIWNHKDISIIDKLVYPDVLIHSLLGVYHGAQALRDVVQVWLTGFPDLKVENDIVIAEKDLVSLQWRARGTHKGEFKGKKPSGKPVAYSGVTVYRIKDGQIVEYWAYLDMQHLLAQI